MEKGKLEKKGAKEVWLDITGFLLLSSISIFPLAKPPHFLYIQPVPLGVILDFEGRFG